MHTVSTRRRVLTVAIGALALAGCGVASRAPISPPPTVAARATKGAASGGATGAMAATPAPAANPAAAPAPAPTPAAPPSKVLPLLPGTTGVASGTLESSTGSLAPAFSLPDLTGKSVDLVSLRGRPALLSFLATTCAPCAQELPLLARAQQALGDGLRVVLIGIGDTPADLAAFVASHDATGLTTLADERGATARAYGIGLIPSSVFLDVDGRIAAVQVGALDAASLVDRLAKAGVADAASALGSQPATSAPAGGPPVCCPVPGN